MTSLSNKKEIYGSMRSKNIGGCSPTVDHVVLFALYGTFYGGIVEPVTFNSSSVEYGRGQKKAYNCKSCYVITPLDGCLCLANIELGNMYIGVCFNEHHLSELKAWLTKQILKRTSSLPTRSSKVRLGHRTPAHQPTHPQTDNNTNTHTLNNWDQDGDVWQPVVQQRLRHEAGESTMATMTSRQRRIPNRKRNHRLQIILQKARGRLLRCDRRSRRCMYSESFAHMRSRGASLRT